MGAIVLYFDSCKKTDYSANNPYNNGAKPPVVTDEGANLDPNSFQGLHYFIFNPTCANSGCHDGTFEPDFRTVESSYNTLVYHPIKKNDPAGSFKYRVLPGNADKSVIICRLTKDIDGQSDTMPLITEPNSDWYKKKDQYIDNIKTWINNGAKDMFGNKAQYGNKIPQIAGVIAYANGVNTLLDRDPGKSSIKVPPGTTSLNIWVSFSDDSTSASELSINKYNLSRYAYTFVDSTQQSFTIGNSVTEKGYFGLPVNYTHQFTINPSIYPKGSIIFFRFYVKDPQHAVTEMPEKGSANYIMEYCSFRIL